MIPHFCRVKHDPPHTFGDCLRACVASIFDVEDPETVPHFYHDDPPVEVANKRLDDWCAERGFFPFIVGYDGVNLSFQGLRSIVGIQSPDLHYLVLGSNHIVVCQGDKMVHDPAWIPVRMEPNDGIWQIMLFVKI